MNKKSAERIFGKEKKKNPKWFYLILFLIPVVFFILLETALQLFNYGNEYKVFVHLSKSYPGKLFLNAEITKKYFTNLKEGPGTVGDGFDEVKKENAFRVFVLGESSAAGWPYPPNGSFPRYLKRNLELLYPGNTVEVINCGISAINTYTIRDIVPEVLKQKPDLILIYTGHNEYYGALGAGSAASIGNSRRLINIYIWLQKFRSFQLLQNLIKWGYSLTGKNIQTDLNTGNETLMSRMIGESLIPYDSDLFNTGIEQFKGNMEDILKFISEKKIPVIISTLTSNIRDLKPFISVRQDNLLPADQIFDLAGIELAKGKTDDAKKLFIRAKEFDALRFRAPEKINSIIRDLAEKYRCSLIDIDSVFSSRSPYGIVGYNLTVDHLHPTIEGYSLMGREFFKRMDELNLVPKGRRLNISYEKQDSIMTADLPYTPLDSTISYMRLITLIGSYPFVPKGSPNLLQKNFKFDDFNDTLAFKVINKELFWETAHAKAADIYYSRGDFKTFMKEIDAIIQERTYETNGYEYASEKLIDANLHNDALKYLYPLNRIKPSYFTNKWIGQIELNNKNYQAAFKYLLEASRYPESDWQTWYNLAGAYYFKGDSEQALEAVQKSLKLNSENPLARSLYIQLKRLQK